MKCEACNQRKALTTPVDGIDLGKRFVCHNCITLPTDTLARMIRKRGEEENKRFEQLEHEVGMDERQFQLRWGEEG